jgi:hypothetical protein
MVNNDPRYLAARDVLNDIPPNIAIKLYKPTRAGATTGILAVAVDDGVGIGLIAPTKKIAHEIFKDATKYADKDNANLQIIKSNHSCLLNESIIKDHPDVGKLPILPLPRACEKCSFYNECDFTAVVRSGDTKLDGIGITYDKLNSIILSSSMMAKKFKEKIYEMDVFLFDEVHRYETPDMVSVTMYPHLDLGVYKKVFNGEKYKVITEVLGKFSILKHEDIGEDAIRQLVTEAEEASMQKGSKHYAATQIIQDAALSTKMVSAALKELIVVMINRSGLMLSIGDVLMLSNIILLMSNETLVLRYIRENGEHRVFLSAEDGLLASTKRFITEIKEQTESFAYCDKKIILTTATFGDMDYTETFGLHGEAVMPDVMHGNEKMTIYADIFNLDSINYSRKYRDRIVDAAKKYSEMYEGIRFICPSIKIKNWLYHRLLDMDIKINVDYYRSDRTIGVASKERRCVCVGAPVSPTNAMDGISSGYDESQRKRINGDHAAFYQAISRFKDPAGIEESFIYCIGITEDNIEKMATWGRNRCLEMNGRKCDGVVANKDFTFPTIIDTRQQKILSLITKKDEITRNEIMQKLNMLSADVKKYLQIMLDEGVITVKTSSRKRKPLVYSTKL